MPDLKKFDSERLCKYHETLLERLIEMPHRHVDIEKRRADIITELVRRAEKSEFIRPKQGLLSFYGYRVGRAQGKKEEYRRKVLTKIYQEETLPIIGSLLYVKEWGEPKSPERLHKMKNCLTGFLNSNYPTYMNMDKAFEEWKADLEWLEQNFNL